MADTELNGVRIHYTVAGDGTPYVFCNGLGGNSAGFVRDDLPWYAERFRTVAWDQRGLGKSGPAPKYSLPLYAADLAALLDDLEIERAIIHGVSWGGVLTQRFALDYPERCAALVLDSTSSEVNVGASENWYARGELARLGEQAIAGRDLPPAFEGHATVSAAAPPAIAPEHLDSYVAQARATASLREHPLTPYLDRIECPTLIVAGGSDVVAGAGGSVVISRKIPSARLEILEGVGHGVYQDARERFRMLLLSFLADGAIN
ncbi:MAG: alpha/beta hydrolase [Chloroflexi bacterium]|nr:alpha/beta hydrolase [Chloroflexota bacterium]MDA1146576.1 alpha/beta hydrolase [Chloroflexota bacterium]MQC82734.1 alpha/beta hydrolase [Chloroflexota bacterium]